MPVTISQLRPEGLQDAIEFAKTTGCTVEPEGVDTHVSLVAHDGETIVAAVLGLCQEGRSCELNICLGKFDEPDKLTGDLINKALMKVHGAGIRRCRINHHGRDDLPADWPNTQWTGQDDSEAA
jgi:hypothetical protein